MTTQILAISSGGVPVYSIA